MSADSIDRRGFLSSGLAAGAALALPASFTGCAPSVHRGRSAEPRVIASANGLMSRDAQGRSCVELAWERITAGDDPLDAVVAGVTIVELDPEDTSVGYGGLPNADGVVQLDAAVMDGTRRHAGAVAALEGIRTPTRVALAVARQTDHHLLAGDGAQQFARSLGFQVEDLTTPRSRALWNEWRRRVGSEAARGTEPDAGRRAGLAMVRDGLIDPAHFWGTVHCAGRSPAGHLAAATTTSGLAWKLPGRVGDSPILGAGLYVDAQVGSAGSTGLGEANLYNLSCFLIIENLRHGMSPADAGLDALGRIRRNTVDPRLLDDRGRPDFDVRFYILDATGEYAGVGLQPGGTFAVCDRNGPREEDCVSLLS